MAPAVDGSGRCPPPHSLHAPSACLAVRAAGLEGDDKVGSPAGGRKGLRLVLGARTCLRDLRAAPLMGLSRTLRGPWRLPVPPPGIARRACRSDAVRPFGGQGAG